jgi:hypothetical protein
MPRIVHIGSILLLAVGVGFGSDQKTPKDSPPPPAPKVKNQPAPKGGTPKAQAKDARLVNPTNVVTRMYRMTPEQREQILEKLPPVQQENFRKQLTWFDGLPKEQQDIQLRRIDRYEQLPPEKKVEVGAMIKAANQLPPGRKAVIRRVLTTLQVMDERQRENMLNRPQFQARFSAEELHIITVLADAWMGPMQ